MKNELKEKIFDLVLTEALKESLDRELQEIDEMVANSPPHEFSPQFEKRMKKLINSIGRKERIKKYTQMCIKVVVTAAAIMGVLFGGLLTQPTVYAAVENVIRTIFDRYDKYDYIGDELTVDNFNNNIRLGYVPDGYYLSSGDYFAANVILIYKDIDDNELSFDYSIADGTSSVYDNEHNSYIDFTINGNKYYYYESNDSDFPNTIVWYDKDYSFSISAHISKEELIKIAENVK